MQNISKSAIVLLAGIVMALLLGASSVTAKELTAAGCKTEHFMLRDLSAAYTAKTGNTVQLGRIGNLKALTMLHEDQIDFAYTCKPITDLAKKSKLDRAVVKTWESVPIGKDPIVIISNYVNGVDNLSVTDLTRVFKGEIKNWKELGGNDVPVKVGYLSDSVESGIVLLFKEFTVGNDGQLDPNGTKVDDPVKLGQFVYATPGGISFVSHNSVFGDRIKELNVDGVNPTQANILNGQYKLAATYYLTFPVKRSALVADFIAFSQSKEGQSIVATNFIPYVKENQR